MLANRKIADGHGMCFGAFSFNPKGNYKARFTSINTDGIAFNTAYCIAFIIH